MFTRKLAAQLTERLQEFLEFLLELWKSTR
jgi:hypothetical protein